MSQHICVFSKIINMTGSPAIDHGRKIKTNHSNILRQQKLLDVCTAPNDPYSHELRAVALALLGRQEAQKMDC